MTLHEIEETLAELIKRHPGLDEKLLVTLLRAGGWEEKTIEEAKTLFASRGDPKEQQALPTLQEEPLLMPEIGTDHLLEEGTQEKEEPVSEPQSLIKEETPASVSKKEELPHNLPLRPFETSEHIWPFSRYKDVFYGESEESFVPASPPKSFANETTAPLPLKETKAPAVSPVSSPAPSAPLAAGGEIHITPVPKTKGDEKLVMMASIMLLSILLMLGYMYGNGRL